MKPAAFLFAEIVAIIVHDQLDNRPLGQVRWFIEYQSTFLYVRSKTAHIIQCTARASTRQGDGIASVRIHGRVATVGGFR